MLLNFKNPKLVYKFSEEEESDVFIHHIGYDDFHFVEPATLPIYRARFSLHYVFSGSGTIYIDGKAFAIGAKQFFYVPMTKKVCYYPNDDDKWQYFWFDFNGFGAENFVNKMGFDYDHPVKDAPDDFSEMEFYSFVNSFNEKGEAGYYKAKSMLYLIADVLSENHKRGNYADVLATEAKELIKLNHESGEFSLESVSEALHVSYSYLSKIFKIKTGKTLMEYLINVRLNHAADMLKETALTAKQIAYDVGYNDEIHFLKQFKNKFGVTTKQYRLENRL